MEKLLIKGVAKDENVARLALSACRIRPVSRSKFSRCSRRKRSMSILFYSQSAVTIQRTSALRCRLPIRIRRLRFCRKSLSSGSRTLEAEDDVVKVSIVGAGMQSNPGVAAKMFEALYDAISTFRCFHQRDQNFCFVARKMADRAVAPFTMHLFNQK